MIGLECGVDLQQATNCIFIGNYVGAGITHAENLLIIQTESVYIQATLDPEKALPFVEMVKAISETGTHTRHRSRYTLLGAGNERGYPQACQNSEKLRTVSAEASEEEDDQWATDFEN
jgi:hypothetical protein